MNPTFSISPQLLQGDPVPCHEQLVGYTRVLEDVLTCEEVRRVRERYVTAPRELNLATVSAGTALRNRPRNVAEEEAG